MPTLNQLLVALQTESKKRDRICEQVEAHDLHESLTPLEQIVVDAYQASDLIHNPKDNI